MIKELLKENNYLISLIAKYDFYYSYSLITIKSNDWLWTNLTFMLYFSWSLILHILTDIFIRGHPLSTNAKFSEKLTFLTPWYAYVRVRIKELEMLVFRKILRTYLMDGPFIISLYIFQITLPCIIPYRRQFFGKLFQIHLFPLLLVGVLSYYTLAKNFRNLNIFFGTLPLLQQNHKCLPVSALSVSQESQFLICITITF